MAYLGLDTSEIESAPVDTGELSPEESQNLNFAFSQFLNGDLQGAASTLGTSTALAAGLSATPAAVVGAAIAIGIGLMKLIGRGRAEADIIVPVQNQIISPRGTGQLDQITQLLIHNPSVPGLQQMYDEVQRIGIAFMQFLQDPRFHDGRASQQAANTIFPYINGTCGYAWPPPMQPSQANCLTWGAGTPGGAGTDGMLGAIARAILKQGGAIPAPILTQGQGPYPQLQTQGSQTFPWITQAGTLPNISPYSPLQPSTVPVLSAGFGNVSTVLLIGAAAYLLLRNRG